jgi:hypothetical protein
MNLLCATLPRLSENDAPSLSISIQGLVKGYAMALDTESEERREGCPVHVGDRREDSE